MGCFISILYLLILIKQFNILFILDKYDNTQDEYIQIGNRRAPEFMNHIPESICYQIVLLSNMVDGTTMLGIRYLPIIALNRFGPLLHMKTRFLCLQLPPKLNQILQSRQYVSYTNSQKPLITSFSQSHRKVMMLSIKV